MIDAINILSAHCITVLNKHERFKLTSENVKIGDVIRETSTDLFYYVTDTSNLNKNDGYKLLPYDTDWVSVDNHLPKPFTIVTIKCENGHIGKGFMHTDKSWWAVGTNMNVKITDTKVVLWSSTPMSSIRK